MASFLRATSRLWPIIISLLHVTLAGCSSDSSSDCCSDAKCRSIKENCCIWEYDNASCSDGVDNDGNGLTDCADPSCASNFASVCNSGLGEMGCTDGMDDDGDGWIDCLDKDCSWSEACRGDGSPEDTLDKCMDGIDNDGNGFTDCSDFSCSKSTDPNIAMHCSSVTNEPQQPANPDCANREGCASNAAMMDKQCSDGIDNDLDGFVDCADWDCSRNPRVVVCANAPRVCGNR